MTDLPPPSRDLPPGVHAALRTRVLEGTYDTPSARRRWLLPLAAAAAVLIVLFTAIGVLHRDPQAPAPGPVATHPPSPSVSPTRAGPPPANPATFDPLWTRLTPGWLPEGMPVKERYVGRSTESMRVGSVEEPLISIEISSRTYRAPAGIPGDSTTPGPDVNGRPSTWTEFSNGHRGWLRWQWADGAHATIQFWGFPRDPEGNARTAARIANGLHPQSPRPMALPFTLRGPAYAWVLDTRADRFGENYVTGVRFGPSGGVLKETTVDWRPDVFVHDAFPSNVTINGREANVRTEEGALVVRQAFDRNVAEVRCTPKPGASTTAVRAECVAIATSLRPAGDQKAPSSWSTEPVR